MLDLQLEKSEWNKYKCLQTVVSGRYFSFILLSDRMEDYFSKNPLDVKENEHIKTTPRVPLSNGLVHRIASLNTEDMPSKQIANYHEKYTRQQMFRTCDVLILYAAVRHFSQ